MRQQSEELLEDDSIEVPDLAEDATPTSVESAVDPVDLLQIEVFTSSAVKNIGRFNCEFVKGEKLGRGAFGSAWRCHHLVDEQDYCVKELRLAPSKFCGSAARMVNYARGILREVSALSHCESHDNVVKYNAAWAEVVSERSLSGVDESEADSNTLGGDEDVTDDATTSSPIASSPTASSHTSLLATSTSRSLQVPPPIAERDHDKSVDPQHAHGEEGSGGAATSLTRDGSGASWASNWSSDDAEWVRGWKREGRRDGGGGDRRMEGQRKGLREGGMERQSRREKVDQ